MMRRSMIPCGAMLLVLCGGYVHGQSIHQVNRKFDSVNGNSGGSLAGLGWDLRQQILIDESRLTGLKGKKLLGLVFRRDLGYKEPQSGGTVTLTVSLSKAPHAAAKASPIFAKNVTASTQKQTFQGVVTLLNSPKVTATTKPWGAANSVTVTFSTPFTYTDGSLCIDLLGKPSATTPPEYWLMDREAAPAVGKITSIGQSCSDFAESGQSLDMDLTDAQIGMTMRLVLFGRPGSVPLLLIGARSMNLDLTVIGAPGCRQYVDPVAQLPMQYNPPKHPAGAAFTNFSTQIPPDSALLGVSVYFQAADLEKGTKTNAAGLTSSNAVKMELSRVPPSLGMSIVQALVPSNGPTPVEGAVDVRAAPVMRILY